MFNIKVFKLKDLIKYFIELIVVVSIILATTKFVTNIKKDEKPEENKKEGLINVDLTSCIAETSELIKETNSKDSEIKAYKSDFFEDVLKSQIGSIEDYENDLPIEEIEIANTDENKEMEAESDSSYNIEKVDDIELAKTGLNTQIVTPNPIPLSYNFEYGNVKIKNETSFDLTEEMVNPNINITNKNIILFHTHTCESYTSSSKFSYTPTGTFRTTDLNFTVARVGDELTHHLTNYGYNVIHNKDYHDYPSYNGSYNNSLETVENILKTNPADIIFDIHRDAIGSRSDYAPSVKIGDEDVCAQIMFVIGTNEGGLWHPNWNQNLKFAVKVQQKAEEMYPGLFKPIMLTKYRYNQHTGKYASIIEVGSTGNTLEQCLNSMKYLAKVLDEIL